MVPKIPPVEINLDFCTVTINMSDLMFALILLIMYKRFARYIIRLYNFDRAPEKQNKIAYYIVNIIALLFMGACLILIISVDSK